tara:strand:+ start:373 stop:843 length:471 start_codon:yes stop_codon:yes gene_type:complete
MFTHEDEIQARSSFNDGWTQQFYKDKIEKETNKLDTSKYIYTQYNIGGETIKDNETYVLTDNKQLNNLVVSSTLLRPSKETRGHSHKGQEEVYHFIKGNGEMTLGEETFEVTKGNVVLIPDGVFHKVKNTSSVYALHFVCVFNGRRKELDYNKCDE